MKDTITKNIRELRGRIADACEEHDRDVDDIQLVAISKNHSAVALSTAVAAGLHEIGESRIQEAETKFEEVGHIARFHMVGHLQTNKVKKAVALFDVIQSVDSLKLAEEINRQAGLLQRRIECLIEVNCSGEKQKFGVLPDEALDLIKAVTHLPQINVTGLMTIGPNTENDEIVRASFRLCYDLYKRGGEIVGKEFDTLSMGMSSDFPLAIAEGSTMIRVGSSIFGPRPALQS